MTAPIGRLALGYYTGLWVTAYAIYGRPPTIAAHAFMLLFVALAAVWHEVIGEHLARRRTRRRTR